MEPLYKLPVAGSQWDGIGLELGVDWGNLPQDPRLSEINKYEKQHFRKEETINRLILFPEKEPFLTPLDLPASSGKISLAKSLLSVENVSSRCRNNFLSLYYNHTGGEEFNTWKRRPSAVHWTTGEKGYEFLQGDHRWVCLCFILMKPHIPWQLWMWVCVILPLKSQSFPAAAEHWLTR